MMKFFYLAYCVSVSCHGSNINQGDCFHQKSYNPKVDLKFTWYWNIFISVENFLQLSIFMLSSQQSNVGPRSPASIYAPNKSMILLLVSFSYVNTRVRVFILWSLSHSFDTTLNSSVDLCLTPGNLGVVLFDRFFQPSDLQLQILVF